MLFVILCKDEFVILEDKMIHLNLIEKVQATLYFLEGLLLKEREHRTSFLLSLLLLCVNAIYDGRFVVCPKRKS